MTLAKVVDSFTDYFGKMAQRQSRLEHQMDRKNNTLQNITESINI